MEVGLPCRFGSPIFISAQPSLTAYRGKLLARGQRGTPVHAASFIRARRIILDDKLLEDTSALRWMLTHELFHFVWVRLGNRIRESFNGVIQAEHIRQARGEIGESASAAKDRLKPNQGTGRVWREYVCEAFCDTAAYAFSGAATTPRFGLRPRWIRIRTAWLQQAIDWNQRCY